jgi:thiosulfate dehydrogenase
VCGLSRRGRQGKRAEPDSDKFYEFPPVWGPDSYNTGAGMHRLLVAARFIRFNMPFGTSFEDPVIGEEDAYDVAAFINSQPRPVKPNLEHDFPDRARKPLDAPFPPWDDHFSAEQHKYGPFQPMIDYRRGKQAAREAAK